MSLLSLRKFAVVKLSDQASQYWTNPENSTPKVNY